MDKLLTVALKEFKDGLRNRWAVAITVIFAALSLGITYFGAAASGALGFTSLHSTIISLSSLAVILIPLIALMLSYNAFVGEFEQGTLLLLLTYPLSRGQLLFGKFLGQGIILAAAAVLGFGVAALAIVIGNAQDAGDVLGAFSGFILSAILLGWVFIALAYLISIIAAERSKAAGVALLVWFLFVLVFDLAIMALLVATQGDLDRHWIPLLLMLNPTDVFRLINYLLIGAEDFAGVLQIAQYNQSGLGILVGVMLIWIGVPLLLAWWLFNKKEI